MKAINKILVLFFIIFLFCLGASSPNHPPAPEKKSAYVEFSLWESDTDRVSIIVTAGDSQAAARAVARLGG